MLVKSIATAAALVLAALSFTAPAQAKHKHHHHGHHGHHNHYGYHGHAAAAGVFGFAAGAMLGAAMAPRPAPQVVYSSDWVAYCSAKYNSYNPATNLYLGYDGYYHPCR
jgi:hypothetical protein